MGSWGRGLRRVMGDRKNETGRVADKEQVRWFSSLLVGWKKMVYRRISTIMAFQFIVMDDFLRQLIWEGPRTANRV